MYALVCSRSWIWKSARNPDDLTDMSGGNVLSSHKRLVKLFKRLGDRLWAIMRLKEAIYAVSVRRFEISWYISERRDFDKNERIRWYLRHPLLCHWALAVSERPLVHGAFQCYQVLQERNYFLHPLGMLSQDLKWWNALSRGELDSWESKLMWRRQRWLKPEKILKHSGQRWPKVWIQVPDWYKDIYNMVKMSFTGADDHNAWSCHLVVQ